MRQEDKEVDGPDLEQAEERKRENELVEEKDDELLDLDGKPETFVDKEKSGPVIEAMRKILAGEQIVVNDLKLDKRHQTALEALKTAVEGKDQELSRFVYAEDRRTLLEQSLAVLQPELASISELGKPFEDLLKNVTELREMLNTLEDAEEELVEGRVANFEEESDTDDKDDDDDEDDDTSLTGPERKIAKPPTSLTGKEIKEEPKPGTSLTGKEIKEEPKPPTSLTGKEVKEEPKGPTSLGDAKDIAEAAKRNARG